MGRVTRAGLVFLALFVGAFFVSAGELMGTFADPDRVVIERFADAGNRARDIVGAYLMAMAGMAFFWFVHVLARDTGDRRPILVATGAGAGGAMVLAAVAWATVPLSLTFGSWVDDPGLEVGQAVLPQFGYVALGLGAMLPAAALMVLAARTPGLLPRWLAGATYPAALLVAFTALLFMPMFVFMAWVAAVVATRRRPR